MHSYRNHVVRASLHWPLAMLVLGPLGILAFYLAYQGRPLGTFKDKPAPKIRCRRASKPCGWRISTIAGLGGACR